MRRHALLAITVSGLLGAAAPVASQPDELSRELAGRTPGKTVDCVDKSSVSGPQIIDSRTLIFRESGRRIWRNDLPDACPSLHPMDTLVIELFGSQMCRNDQFRPVSAGSSIPGPACRLGSFTPYDLPK